MQTFSLAHLEKIIVSNLHIIRKIPFDVIVHLPRSGTIPASILATYLCRPLASVQEFCAGEISTRKSEFKSLHRILLVDDSINTGTQMQAAIDEIKARRPDAVIHPFAVYSNEGGKDRRTLDAFTLHSHGPNLYMMPWFMWKTKRIIHAALDMDGVLCRDCTRNEDDEGEKYLEFLRTAEPLFKPMHPVGAIVTGRLEKYRPQTQKWLKDHGIAYKQLHMGPWKTNQQRRQVTPEFWKAEIYKNSPQTLFVESSYKQAVRIAEMSGKAVWCIETMEEFPCR